MESGEKNLLGIIFALSANSELKAKITPLSMFDFMCRTRQILDDEEKDVFWAYHSVESVRQSMDRLASIRIMENKNDEYRLTGIGLMRGIACTPNKDYGAAAIKAAKEWIPDWAL